MALLMLLIYQYKLWHKYVSNHDSYGEVVDQFRTVKLLLEAKKLKDRERDGGRSVGDRTLNRLQQRYFEILKDGYKLNPEPKRRPGQRGQLKRGKPLNMLNRF